MPERYPWMLYMGSSPRMRGTLPDCRMLRHGVGIIPAYAGNTHDGYHDIIFFGDHPRVCGEHMPEGLKAFCEAGSSPRMRGTLYGIPAADTNTGIIPAYAGNTLWRRTRTSSSGDHPRVCGEHLSPCENPQSASGSSPRMRGTRTLPSCRVEGTGIIPAYAGNTRLW